MDIGTCVGFSASPVPSPAHSSRAFGWAAPINLTQSLQELGVTEQEAVVPLMAPAGEGNPWDKHTKEVQ